MVGIFAVLGSIWRIQIDALRDRDADGHRLASGTSSSSTGSVRTVARGQPFDEVNHLDPADVRPLDHDQLHGGPESLALLLFGGAAIHNFVLALLIGIISGTYSSIFNASPLLVVWNNWDMKRLGRTGSSRAPRTRRAAS